MFNKSNKKKLSVFIMTMFIFSMFFVQAQSAFAADQNPLSKMSTVTSMQSNADITLKVSAENLSQTEQQIFTQLMPIISNMNLKITTKTVKTDDNTAGAYIEMATSIMGAPLNMEVWAKTENKDGKPNVNEIIKMPNLPGMQLPNGKEYLVMDTAQLADMGNVSGAQNLDMSKYTELSKQLAGIINSLSTEMQDKFKLITDKGDATVTTSGGIEATHEYEIKLDDTSFKALAKYAVDNLLQNKDFIKLIEQLVVSQSPQNKAEDMDSQIAQTTTAIDKVLDSLTDVKLVDDKGIDCKYEVNSDGYVVSENGTINLIIDAAKLQAIFNQMGNSKSSEPALTGVYKIGIDFTNTNENINQDIKIDYPEVNSDNSTNMVDMMKSLAPTGTDTIKNDSTNVTTTTTATTTEPTKVQPTKVQPDKVIKIAAAVATKKPVKVQAKKVAAKKTSTLSKKTNQIKSKKVATSSKKIVTKVKKVNTKAKKKIKKK